MSINVINPTQTVILEVATIVGPTGQPGPIGPIGPKGADASVTLTNMQTAYNAGSAPEKYNFENSISSIVTYSGLVAYVKSFQVGNFSYDGGTISLLATGTWYVGIEMWSKQLRILPRLGHRGWIPLAKVVTNTTTVTSITSIEPIIPVCRTPRTTAKVLAGKSVNVVIMGSSLTSSGGGNTDWPGMIFGAGAPDKYKLPTTVTTKYRGVGGSQIQYQMAQLGYASHHDAYGFSNSGASGPLLAKSAPNGRSAMFNNVDLVVIGCLANGGSYRLECIEPIVRKLKQRGVEVIMITDNPAGPSTNYNTMTGAALYNDGTEVMRIAELYGVEVADTAAYVFESYIRANGVGIYRDTIHQAYGIPNGVAPVSVANGNESYARAVRSIFSIGVTVAAPATSTINHDFSTDVQGWRAWGNGTYGSVSAPSGVLVSTKTSNTAGQWGMEFVLPSPLNAGDTIQISGTATANGPTIGAQFGGINGPWSSTIESVPIGTFSVSVTCLKTTYNILFLATPDNAAIGATLSLDNLTMTLTKAGAATAFDNAMGRAAESRPLPSIRMVADLQTPADAFVILPSDEVYIRTNNTAKGTLGAHPWGIGSFARCWTDSIGTNADLLTLVVGQKACVTADAAVGLSLVHYRAPGDGIATVNVNINGVLNKTITFSDAPFANEWYNPILSPVEAGVTNPLTQLSVELQVVTGSIKIAALVGLTADIEYITPEQITFVGDGWLPKENSRSGLPGRPTDSANNYAMVKSNGRRLAWILSCNPGSKPVSVWSDNETKTSVDTSGNYHVKAIGGAVGSNGANHVILCQVDNATGSQANGHALHVGGAIAINDR